jgi:hypothetical protein
MRPELLTRLGNVWVENTVIDTETAIPLRRVSNSTPALLSQLTLSPGEGGGRGVQDDKGKRRRHLRGLYHHIGGLGAKPNPSVSFFYSQHFSKASHISVERRGGGDLRSSIFNAAEAADHCECSVEVTPTTDSTYTFAVSSE